MSRVNLNKLKGKLTENEKTYRECAEYLGITVTTFNNKINGRGKFYVDEVNKLSKLLRLSNEEKINIFLD